MAINLIDVRKPLPGNEKKMKKMPFYGCLLCKRPVGWYHN